jgi:hypothetical protein
MRLEDIFGTQHARFDHRLAQERILLNRKLVAPRERHCVVIAGEGLQVAGGRF